MHDIEVVHGIRGAEDGSSLSCDLIDVLAVQAGMTKSGGGGGVHERVLPLHSYK